MAYRNTLLPTLNELVDRSPFEVGPGIGLNEIIVAAGYHPFDYGRNAHRAFGGRFPHPDNPAWEEINTPFRMMRELREEA